MKKQLEILNSELEIIKSNKRNKGVMLIGSVAYENASEDADLDLVVLSDKDDFVSKYVNGILVEIHFQKYSTMLKNLKSNPIEVYKYIYSKILLDNGELIQLVTEANKTYENYKTPSKEMESIIYWLSSTKLKLLSAIKSNDIKRVSYLISTNTWKVLEGVWAINNKPIPPSSLVFNKHNILKIIPCANWFDNLFIGDTLSRANFMIEIIDWISEQ